MTIVLQHQFQDLILDDNGFEVNLSFGGQNQRLYIPFDVVTSFADPSVNFGIQIKSEFMKNTNTEKNAKDDNVDGVLSIPRHPVNLPEDPNDLKTDDPKRKLKNEIDGAEVINFEAFR